jgi:hypothetical protein
MIMLELVGCSYMTLTPAERLKRLRAIQRLAAEQAESERLRPRDMMSDRLAHRIQYLRLRELRGWLMIEAQINECRRRENETERDREQQLDDDWTRR